MPASRQPTTVWPRRSSSRSWRWAARSWWRRYSGRGARSWPHASGPDWPSGLNMARRWRHAFASWPSSRTTPATSGRPGHRRSDRVARTPLRHPGRRRRARCRLPGGGGAVRRGARGPGDPHQPHPLWRSRLRLPGGAPAAGQGVARLQVGSSTAAGRGVARLQVGSSTAAGRGVGRLQAGSRAGTKPRRRQGEPRSPRPGREGNAGQGPRPRPAYASSRSTSARPAGSIRASGTSPTLGTNEAAIAVRATSSCSSRERIPSRPRLASSSRM
jgi:hypothetical protein